MRQTIREHIDSFFAENPEMNIKDLTAICAKATIILHHNPKITYEDLSDELRISEYSAEKISRMVFIVRNTML